MIFKLAICIIWYNKLYRKYHTSPENSLSISKLIMGKLHNTHSHFVKYFLHQIPPCKCLICLHFVGEKLDQLTKSCSRFIGPRRHYLCIYNYTRKIFPLISCCHKVRGTFVFLKCACSQDFGPFHISVQSLLKHTYTAI